MKALYTIFIIIILVGVMAVATKPGDQQCINETRAQLSGAEPVDQLLGSLAVNRHTVRIEDNFFYKQIYTVTGEHIGYAAFGRVVINE